MPPPHPETAINCVPGSPKHFRQLVAKWGEDMQKEADGYYLKRLDEDPERAQSEAAQADARQRQMVELTKWMVANSPVFSD
jgi:hypothetical protein